MSKAPLFRGPGRYLLAAAGTAAVTLALLPLRAQINSTTVGFAYLLLIVFVAILCGSAPALVASVLAVLPFNFFFLPPFHTFAIADPQNWLALTVFFITALAVGQLSARAKRRAEEAEAAKREAGRSRVALSFISRAARSLHRSPVETSPAQARHGCVARIRPGEVVAQSSTQPNLSDVEGRAPF